MLIFSYLYAALLWVHLNLAPLAGDIGIAATVIGAMWFLPANWRVRARTLALDVQAFLGTPRTEKVIADLVNDVKVLSDANTTLMAKLEALAQTIQDATITKFVVPAGVAVQQGQVMSIIDPNQFGSGFREKPLAIPSPAVVITPDTPSTQIVNIAVSAPNVQDKPALATIPAPAPEVPTPPKGAR